MFAMRFDLRAPDFGAPIGELYATAVEMAEWGEQHGCLVAIVSEHHASPDGYLPSPLLLCAAIAARTRKLPIQVAALLLPLHDPIALAEQMAVLDLLSGGRVSYVCAIGYRAEEYAMFGRQMRGRGRRLEQSVAALRKAWSGEPARRVRLLFNDRQVKAWLKQYDANRIEDVIGKVFAAEPEVPLPQAQNLPPLDAWKNP